MPIDSLDVNKFMRLYEEFLANLDPPIAAHIERIVSMQRIPAPEPLKRTHVVLVGDLKDGFTAIGPFESFESAAYYTATELNTEEFLHPRIAYPGG